MKRIGLFVAALAAVSTALAGFKYEGEWGGKGSGYGTFDYLIDVDVAPNGNVYVSDLNYIQYFTATGSYLGQWAGECSANLGVAVGPQGYVYTQGLPATVPHYFYYTKSGSLLGNWTPKYALKIGPSDIGPRGIVFGSEYDERAKKLYVVRYTAKGGFVSAWKVNRDSKYGASVGVSPDGERVYVAPVYHTRILVYTSAGSFMRSWGSAGSGKGQFLGEVDVDVAPNGRVFATDMLNHRVQYFTPAGSFLGKWGRFGSGPGEFKKPVAIAVSLTGARVYVADQGNYRIQYFNRNRPAIAPASLGRVKALFE